MKSTKKSLIFSALSTILCVAMLLGTTLAWFTDSVTSGKNQIIAGNLDVELYHAAGTDVSDADSNKVSESTMLFDISKWEPGVVAYENFMVKNVGNLALKYQLTMNVGDFNKTTVGGYNLKQVLKVAVVNGGFSGDRTAAHGLDYTTLEAFSTSSNGALLPGAEGDVFGVVIYWEPGDNDNNWNLNNGKTATVVDGKFSADELGIELGVNLFATQLSYEKDSFDKFYDLQEEEVVPEFGGESDPSSLKENEETTFSVSSDEGDKEASATVPANTELTDENGEKVKWDNETDKIQLTIDPDGNPDGVMVKSTESISTYDVSLVRIVTTESGAAGEPATETKTEIKSASNPVLVSLPIGIVDLQAFYHHGEKLTKVESKEAITGEGMYWFDQANGDVYFKTKSFSPFSSVYKFGGGLGTEEYPYLIANADHFRNMTINNKNYKLTDDINLTGVETASNNTYGFIAAVNSLTGGIVDGDNHTVTYNNVAEVVFGSFINSTLKNITFDMYENGGPLCGYIVNAKYENVTVNGNMEFSNNTGVLGFYCSGATADKVTINTNVVSSSYSGVFFGYNFGATYSIKDSSFNGSYVGPYAGLVFGNATYSKATVNITNFKNNGVIRHSNNDASAYNPIVAICSDGQWSDTTKKVLTIDGVTIPNDKTSVSAIKFDGKGGYVTGPEDKGLGITLNEDKTFTVSASEFSEVTSYVVEIIANVPNHGPYGGSTNISVEETINADGSATYKTQLKNLGFANGAAASGKLAGNWDIITVEGTDFYWESNPDYICANRGKQTEVFVRAYDETGMLVSSSFLTK